MQMYDPEESLETERQFQALVNEDLPRFREFLKELIHDDAGISDLLIERLQAALEKLKNEYEDYVNTFDPKEKLLRRQAWQMKSTQLMAIVERLANGVKRIGDERKTRP